MAWFGTKFEQNCWKIEPGLSAYSNQQQEKAERQQKTSRVQFCSNVVPNHSTGLSVAPRSLADSVHKRTTLLFRTFCYFKKSVCTIQQRFSCLLEKICKKKLQCFFFFSNPLFPFWSQNMDRQDESENIFGVSY